MDNKQKTVASAVFLITGVVVLAASFVITLIEGILMQLQDLEFDAMALYLVSIAALVMAREIWKRACTVLATIG